MHRVISIAAFAVTAALLLVLLLLSIRGLIEPNAAAANFGVAITDPSSALYQSVYRSRNLVISVVGIAFLLTRMWTPLAVLTTASIALPLFDIVLLKNMAVPVSAVHPATLIALTIVSLLLWLRVSSQKRAR